MRLRREETTETRSAIHRQHSAGVKAGGDVQAMLAG